MARAYVFGPPKNGSSSLATIYANADGCSIQIPWNSWESSNGSASGGYSFTSFDAAINNQIGFGATSVIPILQPVSFQPKNSFTPSYVFTSGWAVANSVTQLFTCNGSAYSGNGSIPFGTCAQGVDNTAFPVVFQPAFKIAWKAAIQAAVNHMAAQSYASKIRYVRIGGSAGGEVTPFAPEALITQISPSNYTQLRSTWTAYINELEVFINGLNSPFTFDQGISGGLGSFVPNISYQFSTDEAANAVSNGFGFGNQGLQNNDITKFTNKGYTDGNGNTSGWPSNNMAFLFRAHRGAAPLQVQTTSASDPTGNNITGSLIPLLPLALQLGATDFELYYADWQVAYDPTSPNYNTYHVSYAQAIQNVRGANGLQLTVTGGNNQSGFVSTTLPLALSVQATTNGTPQPSITVTFNDNGAGGTFGSNPVVTDSNGNCSTTYTLPSSPATVVINATATSFAPASFTETANANNLTLSVGSGNNQSGFVSSTLPNPLVVNATTNGTLTAGIAVTFSTGSGGSFGTNPATTGSNGAATTTYTLPATPGSIPITATATGFTTAIFNEIANSTTNILSLVSGNNQVASTSALLPLPLVTQATVNGTATAGVSVVWTSPVGTISPGTSTTNAFGLASTTFTNPSVPQVATITANLANFSPATFIETAQNATSTGLGLVTGFFTNPAGVPINGTIFFTLSADALQLSTACFVPVPIAAPVTSGSVVAFIAFNDQLHTGTGTPTSYQIAVKDSTGAQVFGGKYTFVGNNANLNTQAPG